MHALRFTKDGGGTPDGQAPDLYPPNYNKNEQCGWDADPSLKKYHDAIPISSSQRVLTHS